MMQLFLVRHGDSPFTAVSDHQRPLSDLGIDQAIKSGAFINSRIQSKKMTMVASDALRTQITAQVIQKQLSPCPLTTHDHLYHARAGDWCDVISENRMSESLILVGHNPTISLLAKYLNPLNASHFNPACVGHYQLEIAEDGLKLPAQFIDFYKPDAK